MSTPFPKPVAAKTYDVTRIAFDDGRGELAAAIEWAVEQLEDARQKIAKPGAESDLLRKMIHADLVMAETVISELRRYYSSAGDRPDSPS